MDGSIPVGSKPAAYEIEVQPWTGEKPVWGLWTVSGEAHPRSLMSPDGLMSPDDLSGNVRLHISELNNRLSISVYTELDETDPEKAEGLRNRLREDLETNAGEALAEVQDTESISDRERMLKDIINSSLEKIDRRARYEAKVKPYEQLEKYCPETPEGLVQASGCAASDKIICYQAQQAMFYDYDDFLKACREFTDWHDPGCPDKEIDLNLILKVVVPGKTEA